MFIALAALKISINSVVITAGEMSLPPNPFMNLKPLVTVRNTLYFFAAFIVGHAYAYAYIRWYVRADKLMRSIFLLLLPFILSDFTWLAANIVIFELAAVWTFFALFYVLFPYFVFGFLCLCCRIVLLLFWKPLMFLFKNIAAF